MYAKMTTSDLMFSESPDKITSEMSVTVLGDLGNFCDVVNVGSDVSVFLFFRQHFPERVFSGPV